MIFTTLFTDRKIKKQSFKICLSLLDNSRNILKPMIIPNPHPILKAHAKPIQRIQIITNLIILPIFLLLTFDPLHNANNIIRQISILTLIFKPLFHLRINLFQLLRVMKVLFRFLADHREVGEDDIADYEADCEDDQQNDESPAIEDIHEDLVLAVQEEIVDVVGDLGLGFVQEEDHQVVGYFWAACIGRWVYVYVVVVVDEFAGCYEELGTFDC